MQNRKRGEKIKAGELDRQIGLLLAYNRNGANLRQEDVANAIGFTLQQYKKYENGRDMLRLGILHKIFNALNMQPSQIHTFNETIRAKHEELNK